MLADEYVVLLILYGIIIFVITTKYLFQPSYGGWCSFKHANKDRFKMIDGGMPEMLQHPSSQADLASL